MISLNCLASGYRERLIPALDRFPLDAVLLLMRVVIGNVFLLSALTKVDGFALSSSAVYLFREEYALPLLPPVMAAWLATLGELSFSLLLWAGLGTRFAALGLLMMTAVIQTFVYPEAWVTHGMWAACLLVLILRGPGAVSMDYLITRICRRRASSGE